MLATSDSSHPATPLPFWRRLISEPHRWSLAGIGLIYWLTRNPYASFGDALGVLYHASLGFDWATNATSHFLYLNACALSLKLLPFLDPVLVLTLFSLVFSLLSLHSLYQLIRWAGASEWAATLSMIAMGLSFTWWRQSVTIEVYTFSCWVGLQLLKAMARDWRAEVPGKYAYAVGIWLGIALLTHIQYLLLGPLLAWYWLGPKRPPLRKSALSLLLSLLVCSPLFLLPWWLDTHSLKAVFFDQGYQSQVLQFEWEALLKGSLRSLGYLAYNFHLFLPFLLLGLGKSWRQLRPWLWVALLAGGPIWLFAMRYNVSDNYVFFLWPYFVALIPASLGWDWLKKKLRKANWSLILALLLGPLVYFTAWQVGANVPALQTFAVEKQFKGGVRYYLWPGQAASPDPLQLGAAIYQGEQASIPDFDRYPLVIDYLQRIGELPADSIVVPGK